MTDQADNTHNPTPATEPLALRLSDQLGPVGWRYVPSDVWGDQVLTQDPKTAQLARDMGRDVEPLYTEAQMLARVAAERERIAAWWDGRVYESSPEDSDIGASIRAGVLVPWRLS